MGYGGGGGGGGCGCGCDDYFIVSFKTFEFFLLIYILWVLFWSYLVAFWLSILSFLVSHIEENSLPSLPYKHELKRKEYYQLLLQKSTHTYI